MNNRTAAAVAALAALLVGCTSGADSKPAATPPPSPSPSASPTATLSVAARKAWCTGEIVAGHAGRTGPVESDPRPAVCLGLDGSDFFDAYRDALDELNRKGREALMSPSPAG